jgi:cell division protein FtsA
LLKLDFRAAEKLKLDFGSATALQIGADETISVTNTETGAPRTMPRKVLCEIIECRLRELAGFVKDAAELAGLSEMPRGGVMLTGGGSLLPGFDRLTADILGLPKVKVVQPKASGGHSREIGTPKMATAVGLARYALEEDYDEFEPASGHSGWLSVVRTLKSVFGPKA